MTDSAKNPGGDPGFGGAMADVPPIEEHEVDAILERLDLDREDPGLRELVRATERFHRLRQTIERARAETLDRLRSPDLPLDQVIGSAAMLSAELETLEQRARVQRAEAEESTDRLRRLADRVSKGFKASFETVGDRYIASFDEQVRCFRTARCTVKALFWERLLAAGRVDDEPEPVAEGILAVAAAKSWRSALQDVSPTIRRSYAEQLRKLAKVPESPLLRLTPVGAGGTIWACLLAPGRIALLHREAGAARDRLVALDLLDYQPLGRERGPEDLAGGAAYDLIDGRLVIAAA